MDIKRLYEILIGFGMVDDDFTFDKLELVLSDYLSTMTFVDDLMSMNDSNYISRLLTFLLLEGIKKN